MHRVALPLLAAVFTYVIPPGQEPLIGRMLGGAPLSGDCRFEGGALEKEKIVGRFACDGRAAPAVIEMYHPDNAPPSSVRTTNFAIAPGPGSDLPPGLLDAVVAQVRANESGWRWKRVDPPPPDVDPGSFAAPWKTALALVLVPAALGAAVGRGVRAVTPVRVGLRRALLVMTSVLLIVAAILFAPRWPWISIYDPLLAALLFGLGSCVGGWTKRAAPIPLGAIAFSAALTLAGLAGIEGWLRAHPTVLGRARPHSTRLKLSPEERDFRYAPLFPDKVAANRFAHYHGRDLPEGEGQRRILHLGDSMLESSDVPDGTDATTLLEQKHPGEAHYNLGLSATGPDVHLVILRRWIDRVRPHEVILHFFPGNDVTDIDRSYAFCANGPLLDTALAERCPEPSWSFPVRKLLRMGPPPYPLRIAAGSSELAASLAYAWQWTTGDDWWNPGELDDSAIEARLRRVTAIVRAMARMAHVRGIPFTVVALPVRSSFMTGIPVARARVLGALRATGERVLDVAQPFEEAVRAEPNRRWFQPVPTNPHFDVDGQKLYADWFDAHINAQPSRADAP